MDEDDNEDGNGHGHITSLAVLRSHRKLGLATKLMKGTILLVCFISVCRALLKTVLSFAFSFTLVFVIQCAYNFRFNMLFLFFFTSGCQFGYLPAFMLSH